MRAEVAGRLRTADAASALTRVRVVEGCRRMVRAQRTAAVRGCFVTSYSVRGRSVLLIDDVVTSGAQANEAIRALQTAGAADVRFVAIARAAGAPTERGRCARGVAPLLPFVEAVAQRGVCPAGL